ncbi:hypothetical protein CDAR_76091, partial [Caerostris darwini]
GQVPLKIYIDILKVEMRKVSQVKVPGIRKQQLVSYNSVELQDLEKYKYM